MSELRDRIAEVLYERHFRLDGHPRVRPDLTFDDLEDQIRDMYRADADAVIAALPELAQPVSVDYRYVCHPCGSSFTFHSSSAMQEFALRHNGSHNPKDAQ
jgi:hypothetical protein